MSRLRTLSLLALLGAAAPDAQTCAGEPSVIYDVAASTAGGGGSTACLGAALAFPNAARDRATVVTRGSGVAPPDPGGTGSRVVPGAPETLTCPQRLKDSHRTSHLRRPFEASSSSTPR